MFSSDKWFGAEAGFYNSQATQSLRFDDGSSAYLARTATAGNRRTWTFSTWLKRATFTGAEQHIFQGGTYSGGGGTQQLRIKFNADEKFNVTEFNGSSTTLNLITDAVFRDTSAWYHIVVAFDTTQGTDSDRVKIYINGTLQTLGTATYPSQNLETYVNQNTKPQELGRRNGIGAYLDGYLAETIMVDGTQLAPTSFGETKNGTWIPIDTSSLTFGTNGFRLQFAQVGVGTASSSTIGADTSGNNNHFTSSGIVASDCNMPDSPENNFATLNSLDPFTGTLSEGNLKYTNTNSFRASRGNFEIPSSGKWYFEVLNTTATDGDNAIWAGVAHQDTNISAQPNNGSTTKFYGLYNDSSLGILSNGSQSSYTTNQISANGIIQIAVDTDNDKLYVGINNSYYTNATTSASFNASNSTESIDLSGYRPFVGAYQNTGVLNCGQDSSFAGAVTSQGNTDANGIGDFYYAPPSGHLALCTSNLPEPTIGPNSLTQADDHFDTVLRNGTGSEATQALGFQPDFLWTKTRSHTVNHSIASSSLTYNYSFLQANTTEPENTSASHYYMTPTSTGYTVGTGDNINQSGRTFVDWLWKAGGATPTKTYKVVVVSDSGNKYRFRNSSDSATFSQSSVTLDLQEGGTYTFDLSDSSMSGHPFVFSLTSNGTHGGGSEYTTNVTKTGTAGSAGASISITVASGVATLYYYCSSHSAMGGQVNTNSTFGSTNFDGSILSVEQANITAGFSIVLHTGTGSASTIGHGLGVAPDWIITKGRTNTNHWTVLHSSLGATKFIDLNQTNASDTATSVWNDTNPTSTVFSVGTNSRINGSSVTYVSYCFAEVEGYSKFGSYTANGSTDGTFVYTGFLPSFILSKKSSSTSNWGIWDKLRRNDFNPRDESIRPDETNEAYSVDTQYTNVDFVSNGFKIRNVGGEMNQTNNDTYIYMAFGSSFKYANAE